MKRVWLNHWFSTAYNIINLINADNNFVIIGTNESISSPIKSVCNEWYTERKLDDNSYIEFCLDFCKKNKVDVFLPRRGLLEISKNKEQFRALGVEVMVEDYQIASMLNDKEAAYKFLSNSDLKSYIPEFYTATSIDEFIQAYDNLKNKYENVCYKFIKDEGGKSFRLIDNTKKGYASLFKKQSRRISLSESLSILSERDKFTPIMIMPYMPEEEVSVDCLKTQQGIIMIPRIKTYSKIEEVKYDSEIINICQKLYDKFPLEHPCNIQFKYLNGIPYFLEVNTRMSGGIQMSSLAAEVNIPNIAVNKLLGVNKTWKCNYREVKVSHVEIPVII